jgi:hypothetical protein
MDGDGKAVYEMTLLLTPEEARQAVGVLNQLLAVVPSQEKIAENEFDDAPNPSAGGTRGPHVNSSGQAAMLARELQRVAPR